MLRAACFIVSLLVATKLAPAQDKQIPPDSETEAKTTKLIAEVFRKEYEQAKTKDQRIALATSMLKLADESKKRPAEEYVLLRIARDIATVAGESKLALGVVAKIEDRFAIDGPGMKVETIERLVATVPAGEERSILTKRLAEARAIKVAHDDYLAAMKSIDAMPTDPDANLRAGRFLCFNEGNWRDGLAKLGLGSDARLSALAKAETSSVPDPLTIADGWWTLAEEKVAPEQMTILGHAADWYRKALPALKGIHKARVEKRLADARVANQGAGAGPAVESIRLATGLEGRDEKVRAKNVEKYGGNEASETAVEAALKWLAGHQLPDGSWSYDHRGGRCQGKCRNPGTLDEAKIGATSQALLPFLAAGHTHMAGNYKSTVKNGLGFLLRSITVEGGQRGDLMEAGGSMYSHALGSIVLCEAYAMTGDKGLKQPAQFVINHIAYAQDPIGGGWRYQVKQPGDTSVFGWQIAAIASANMSSLTVPVAVPKLSSQFLDNVQAERGSQYGYTAPATGHDATTAIGLLSRMHLGWRLDQPALQVGVKYLAERGPSLNNLYYNYYATQVIFHCQGSAWPGWNRKMRDQLTSTQSQEGHEAGSWFVAGGDHGSERGGRLYCTSMSALILEIYYRHSPRFELEAKRAE